MKNAIYDSSLTDAQWAYLKPLLPKPAQRGRPPADRRRILEAILYVVKGGLPWRYLPTDFPPWQTVYTVFRPWTRNPQWAALNDAPRTLVRKTHAKRSRPTAAILDSQSVKSAGHGGNVGYDAAKRIKGRKAIGVVAGLPLQIEMPNVITRKLTLPGIGIECYLNMWMDGNARTTYAAFDIMLGTTSCDLTAGGLIKSQ